ncbi:MAG: ADP-forming succinate--CoA ligase subunit beta [Candidatus Sericytochromatia bacterium]|nr:ADP-forming succinate--CoA ligase subunit beta [Candidatus Sericytochromatia bacterium]
MKIHEYQGKLLMERFGIPTTKGRVADTPDDAKLIAQEIGKKVAIKAQVHVGGRGKAGGIKIASTPQEAYDAAAAILGMDIKGLKVKKVLVEEAIEIATEYYCGMLFDRDEKRIIIMSSAEGGMEIEEVAEHSPEKIRKVWVDPTIGLTDYQVRQLIFEAGFDKKYVKEATAFFKNLYKLMVESDADLAEINPLAITTDGRMVAADAKITIDENALFRHSELAGWKESEEGHEIEEEAARRGLTFVHLGGNIGIMGNGAGLVMTSLDVVTREGGKPANVLDIGGGAKAEVVKNAIEVVLMEDGIKGIMINIFGGITRCDEVAKGILNATAGMALNVPVVVRLSGTAEEEGRQILATSDKFHPAASMQEAAQKVVALAGLK